MTKIYTLSPSARVHKCLSDTGESLYRMLNMNTLAFVFYFSFRFVRSYVQLLAHFVMGASRLSDGTPHGDTARRTRNTEIIGTRLTALPIYMPQDMP